MKTFGEKAYVAAAWILAVSCWVVAYRKFSQNPVTMETHALWGIPWALTVALGMAEAAAGALMVWRRGAFAGAMIFTAVIAGAVVMHLVHGDPAKTALPLIFLPLAAGFAWVSRRKARR